MRSVQLRLKIFIALFLLITAAGTFGFMALENLSFTDAIYYNIVTISTVGYGDIHPTTPAGRVFTVFLIVMGGATFLGLVANATEMLLMKREARNRMRKVNMVLGVFFSELGFRLLSLFSTHDQGMEGIRTNLLVRANWSKDQFSSSKKLVKGHHLKVDIDALDIGILRDFLNSKRDFLVNLLENPVLIEQEEFSEALLAVFHLGDELSCREGVGNLPESDRTHLAGDINRAYQKLVEQWLDYLRHLKDQYPYLFSLAVRKNPFDPEASPVVH